MSSAWSMTKSERLRRAQSVPSKIHPNEPQGTCGINSTSFSQPSPQPNEQSTSTPQRWRIPPCAQALAAASVRRRGRTPTAGEGAPDLGCAQNRRGGDRSTPRKSYCFAEGLLREQHDLAQNVFVAWRSDSRDECGRRGGLKWPSHVIAGCSMCSGLFPPRGPGQPTDGQFAFSW